MAKRRPQQRPIETFLEAYARGSDRLREAVGEFMQPGPGPNAGDASGKMAYVNGRQGDGPPGQRTGGGVAKGYSKGNVKQGAPWDTTQYDHARKASMYHCGACGANNAVFGEAAAFKCHACESVTKINKIGESFRRSYHRGESDMQRQVSEAGAVASGQCHDESEDEAEEEHDSRCGASDGYPVDDGDPDDPMAPGFNGDANDEEEAYGDGASSISAGGDMGSAGDGAPGGATSEDEAEEEDEEESAPMRAEFKCKTCNTKTMLPHGLAETEDEEEGEPVKVKCRKGHTSMVAPPPGRRFVNPGEAKRESVRTFFRRYARERNRGGYLP
jgi:hypothetical protein